MTTFNLKRYLEKKANYEGAQGYWKAQTRAWMNCTKTKLDAGMSAQEAWQGCLDEYQKGDDNMGWVGTYAADALDKLKKQAQVSNGGDQMQMGAYWDRIKKKVDEGKTVGQAVLETLDECSKDAEKIPSD